VGCELSEGEGEVIEPVCQLEHLGECHMVVTQRHVISGDGVDEGAPAQVEVVEVVAVKEDKLANDMAEGAAVIDACVV
jgi:hypothetical protein